MKPFEGVRVVEAAQMISAPMAGMIQAVLEERSEEFRDALRDVREDQRVSTRAA